MRDAPESGIIFNEKNIYTVHSLINAMFGVLRHFSRNKVKRYKLAVKFPVPLLGIDPGSPWYKTNALTIEPESTP